MYFYLTHLSCAPTDLHIGSLGVSIHIHSRTVPSLICHSISLQCGKWISTLLPSSTPFGLDLGPDLPRADEPSPGILGFSTDRISTYLFVTYTGILTSIHSTSPYSLASAPYRTLPYHVQTSLYIRSFGMMLSPGTFSAQKHSTSELLRTLLRVAASKPTS